MKMKKFQIRPKLLLIPIAGISALVLTGVAVPEQAVDVQVKNQTQTTPAVSSTGSLWDNSSFFGGWDPFQEMLQMQTRIHQMFDDTLSGPMGGGQGRTKLVARSFGPALDLAETSTEFVVTCDVPGIPKENLEIELENNLLVIRGKETKDQREESVEEDYRLHWRERYYGGFERSIRLPEGVDASRITAQHLNGQLIIRLPKSQESKTVKVSIT